MSASKGVRRGCTEAHPGVQLRAPRAKNPRWVARYRDAETGSVRDIRLSPEQAASEASRREFATRLSNSIWKRVEEIRGGDTPNQHADLPVAHAMARYFSSTQGIRERTKQDYLEASDAFVHWCGAHRIEAVRHIGRATLRAYREHCCQGVGATTANSRMTRTGVLLNWLIEDGVLRLHRDDVALGLKKLGTDTITKRDFLTQPKIRVLFEVASRHDTKRFYRNGKPRYQPLSAYLRFMLLSGLRPGEAVKLTWDRVDFDLRQIHVHPTQGKRRIDRLVDLDVCPSLIPMLKLMRQRSEAPRVWANHTTASLDDALDRMRTDPECPDFDYQKLRVTCSTYLACMPSYGPTFESRQLGHSITTAEKFYVGRIKLGVELKTLEAAYGI